MKTLRYKFIIKVENTPGVLLGYYADREDIFAESWRDAAAYDSIVDAQRVCRNLSATPRIDGVVPERTFTVVARTAHFGTP